MELLSVMMKACLQDSNLEEMFHIYYMHSDVLDGFNLQSHNIVLRAANEFRKYFIFVTYFTTLSKVNFT